MWLEIRWHYILVTGLGLTDQQSVLCCTIECQSSLSTHQPWAQLKIPCPAWDWSICMFPHLRVLLCRVSVKCLRVSVCWQIMMSALQRTNVFYFPVQLHQATHAQIWSGLVHSTVVSAASTAASRWLGNMMSSPSVATIGCDGPTIWDWPETKCVNASGPHFEKQKLTYLIFLKSGSTPGKFVLECEGILSSYGMKQCTVPVHFELTLFCLTTFLNWV